MISSAKYNPADSGASRQNPCEVTHVSLAERQHPLNLRSRHTSPRLPKERVCPCPSAGGALRKRDSNRENDHEKTLAEGGSILGVAGSGGDGVVRHAFEGTGSTIGCKQ